MDTAQITDSFSVLVEAPTRSAIVVDVRLGPGHAANAAAILALTLGARCPQLIGASFADGAGRCHPGLYPGGLPILAADAAQLTELHERALVADPPVGVIVLPALGQQTTSYEAFCDWVAVAGELELAGVCVAGSTRGVRRLTGALGLLR